MHFKLNLNIMYNKCMLSGRYLVKSSSKKYHSDAVYGFKRKTINKYVVPDEILQARNTECRFYRLVTAYRQHAHKGADINPVSLSKNISVQPELDPTRYGLRNSDIVKYSGILNSTDVVGTVEKAIEFLKNAYGKTISAEFCYLEEEEEIEWFCKRLEHTSVEELDENTKTKIATELLKSQAFDNFLANKFTGVKRYGGEGAESMMAFFSEFFQLASTDSIEQIVMCMPHRGRLNLLTGMLNFPPVKMFAKLHGNPDFPLKYQGTGDVLSHCIASTDLHFENKSVHVSLLYNPSHLEAVNPVSIGKTRAKQMLYKDGDYSAENNRWSDKVLNLQVHGDAAFTGQGVNQECLAFCKTPHFEVGGSIHLIVNNQLGFTTPADRGRSSRYCSDLAKAISAPVLHVNGDYPESVVKATRIAFEYQRKFRKEVFIDLNCYRQWGHNELDDPTFTNPTMYGIIKSRGTVPDQYAKKLVNEGIITQETVDEIKQQHTNWLGEHLRAVDSYTPEDLFYKKQWEGYEPAGEVITTWDTGLKIDLLTYIGSRSVQYPTGFNIHPNLLRTHITSRLAKVAEGVNIDWSTAETLGIGSLLYEGYNVRISGQDVGRGTFSHRHVMLVDQATDNIHVPLNNLIQNQTAFLEVANSILSEEGVLGYEYGMSIESPNNLIIWEAQFGDFFNGAQIMFDNFISSGEAKWLWSSGLVVLLPHGFDGAGAEHSSSKVERFLQLTNSKEDRVDGDNVNMEVCQPSTPAQYFHLLRRQMLRNYRKPLIVIAPKILLRLPTATSNFSDMVESTSFKPVLGDPIYDTSKVKRVILTSGKHYYNLIEKRRSLGITDTAIIRLECFCPFPTFYLQHELAKFTNAKVHVWSQEEPQNMGAWTFVKPRFENLLGKKILYCGRETSAAPAVGVANWHQEQSNAIITKPFTIDNEN